MHGFVLMYTALSTLQALLLGDIAIETAATNTSNGTKGQPFIFYVTNSAAVCTQPVSEQCLQDKTADDCLSAAYEEVNPDLNGPCPATDGYSLQSCLMMPSVRKIMLLQFAQMNLSTSPAQQQPAPIDRDVTIFSDLRQVAGLCAIWAAYLLFCMCVCICMCVLLWIVSLFVFMCVVSMWCLCVI